MTRQKNTCTNHGSVRIFLLRENFVFRLFLTLRVHDAGSHVGWWEGWGLYREGTSDNTELGWRVHSQLPQSKVTHIQIRAQATHVTHEAAHQHSLNINHISAVWHSLDNITCPQHPPLFFCGWVGVDRKGSRTPEISSTQIKKKALSKVLPESTDNVLVEWERGNRVLCYPRSIIGQTAVSNEHLGASQRLCVVITTHRWCITFTSDTGSG